ncbi:MAG: iron-containing alcohol dehydrogenase [Clostridia bacterium]|nr:iron-containing alcohol dehydrogenase [Clostridia bacterium]MBQ4248899.1 iron-containing alcohol dehydrogenase [Clostridia bacterium]
MAYFEYRTNASYVQGEGALLELKKYAFHLGSRFLIAMACGPVKEQVLAKVKKSFDEPMLNNVNKKNLRAGMSAYLASQYDAMDKKVEYAIIDIDGQQVTEANIEMLTGAARKFNADCIIGIGGGKALDMVRGVYHRLGRPIKVVLCPTIVATNAPASTITVLYNDEDKTVGAWFMPYHPELVLVDTEQTIQAPPITLAAAMGDMVGTTYEGLQTIKDRNTENQIVTPAWALSQCVFDTFYQYGAKAMLSAKTHVQSIAYDSVINLIAHTSGPLSIAVNVHYPHLVDDVIIQFPQCTRKLHGLLVGAGVVPYLIWANAESEEINRYIDFATEVGIPLTFKELEITEDDVKNDLMKYCEIAAHGANAQLTTIKDILTGKMLYDSMIMAEAYINDYRAKKA